MVGHYPDTLQEALRQIKEYPEATIYAGGTDLMVAKKFAHHIIFINHIPELKGIAKRDEYLYLGSCNTFSDLINMQHGYDRWKFVQCLSCRGFASYVVRDECRN